LQAQEASYNLGRAFQQLALDNHAADSYEAVLQESKRYERLVDEAASACRADAMAGHEDEDVLSGTAAAGPAAAAAAAADSHRDRLGLRRDAAYHLRNRMIRTGILNWLIFTYDFEIGSAYNYGARSRYNLQLIYRRTNPRLAMAVLKEYLTI
jgi:hypothetical protein